MKYPYLLRWVKEYLACHHKGYKPEMPDSTSQVRTSDTNPALCSGQAHSIRGHLLNLDLREAPRAETEQPHSDDHKHHGVHNRSKVRRANQRSAQSIHSIRERIEFRHKRQRLRQIVQRKQRARWIKRLTPYRISSVLVHNLSDYPTKTRSLDGTLRQIRPNYCCRGKDH